MVVEDDEFQWCENCNAVYCEKCQDGILTTCGHIVCTRCTAWHEPKYDEATREELKKEIKDELELRRDFGAEFIDATPDDAVNKKMKCPCGLPGSWTIKGREGYFCTDCWEKEKAND